MEQYTEPVRSVKWSVASCWFDCSCAQCLLLFISVLQLITGHRSPDWQTCAISEHKISLCRSQFPADFAVRAVWRMTWWTSCGSRLIWPHCFESNLIYVHVEMSMALRMFMDIQTNSYIDIHSDCHGSDCHCDNATIFNTVALDPNSSVFCVSPHGTQKGKEESLFFNHVFEVIFKVGGYVMWVCVTTSWNWVEMEHR